jgi:hypothetical protein
VTPILYTRVIPLGKERQRLKENIGRESWVYEGRPEKGIVSLNGQPVDVWFFQWDGLSEDVRDQMVISHARVHRKSLHEAFQFMITHPIAVPCKEVKLEEFGGL